MPIRPPRRIFRSSSRSVRLPRLGRPAGVAALALLAAAGAGAALTRVAPTLLGQQPAGQGRIAADPAEVAVVDGETLRVRGVVVQLAGIRAPARGDECQPGLDCGSAASRTLAALVHDRPVRCDLQEPASGRSVGTCFAGPDDLSRGVVAQGWAKADSPDLRAPEQQARNAGLGLWAAIR